ncbi:GspH/FimT family pseudopilin [Methylococcus geothermalis]|uniref:Type II secretion system protein H n=1 Tax=Methylococcus geothermalis TaxID=2681310 RepID=A0A858QA89_9GAMM|nr:GspH/FimT family pseudopilin [Methylococcus geothermalis]QJD30701.1 type II secretion system protein GspH [Methylococcus geothermalis]
MRGHGFTLLEMLLVLGIGTILLAVAVPNVMPAIEAARLSSAARDVASGLRFARGQALSRRQEVRFTLDVAGHRYQVSTRPKAFGLPSAVALKLFTASGEVEGEGVGSIRFFPDGSSTGGRVTLEAAGRKRLIDVNWLTGRISSSAEEADDS